MLLVRDTVLDELCLTLLRAQHRMKHNADLKKRGISYEVGDWVYLQLQPYLQQTIARRSCEKLEARFYGSFQIVEKIGAVAYKLKITSNE